MGLQLLNTLNSFLSVTAVTRATRTSSVYFFRRLRWYIFYVFCLLQYLIVKLHSSKISQCKLSVRATVVFPGPEADSLKILLRVLLAGLGCTVIIFYWVLDCPCRFLSFLKTSCHVLNVMDLRMDANADKNFY